MKQNDERIILMMESNKYLNKGKLSISLTQSVTQDSVKKITGKRDQKLTLEVKIRLMEYRLQKVLTVMQQYLFQFGQ